jgi:hypothetical protein
LNTREGLWEDERHSATDEYKYEKYGPELPQPLAPDPANFGTTFRRRLSGSLRLY